jgi:predicted nucleic acid-binding protein
VILIDTGPLVALCDARDGLHARARADFSKLGAERFGVCTPVVAEAVFHLRAGPQRVRLRELLVSLDAAFLFPSGEDELWSGAFDWIAQYAEHRPDLADAYLVLMSGEVRHARVWTYDEEFRTIWRRPDGSAVPLAIE